MKKFKTHLIAGISALAVTLSIMPAAVASAAEEESGSTVYITIWGDTAHGDSGETHTLKGGNLTAWVEKTAYTVEENTTVAEVIELCFEQNGMTGDLPGGSYVSSVTYDGVTLGELTNGQSSGWMYTVNGEMPLLGISEYEISDGDEIVLYYTDDFFAEDWGSDSGDEIPDETPDETPTEIPDETPTETPDEAPDETPTETPDETPSATGFGSTESVLILVIAALTATVSKRRARN